jgi:hypothetical protein
LGYITEPDLLEVLGRQLGVVTCEIDHRLIEKRWLERFPRPVAEKTLALPVRFVNGALELACADPGVPGMKKHFEELLGCPVRLSLAGEDNLRFAISRAYLSAEGEAGPLLGELLLKTGGISPSQLEHALHLHRQTGRKVGEVLQDLGLVSPQAIAGALREQQAARYARRKGDPQ